MGRANWLYFFGERKNKCQLFVYGISLPTASKVRYNHVQKLGRVGDLRLFVFESVTDDVDIPKTSDGVIQLIKYHNKVNNSLSIIHKNKYIQSDEPDYIRISSPIGQTIYINAFYTSDFYNYKNGMFLKEENKELLFNILTKLKENSGQEFFENYSQRLGCFEYAEAMPWAETSAPFTIFSSNTTPNKYIIKRDKEYSKEIFFVHLIVYSELNDVLLDEIKTFEENATELLFDTEVNNDVKYKYSVFDLNGKLVYKNSNYWLLGLSMQMNIISDTVHIKSPSGTKTISAYTPTKPIEIKYPDNKIIQDINSNIEIINDIKKSKNDNLKESFPEQKWFNKTKMQHKKFLILLKNIYPTMPIF